VQPELNAELNAMSDDEFAAIIGGTASGRPEAEADDERRQHATDSLDGTRDRRVLVQR
jgi:hypothetical protein